MRRNKEMREKKAGKKDSDRERKTQRHIQIHTKRIGDKKRRTPREKKNKYVLKRKDTCGKIRERKNRQKYNQIFRENKREIGRETQRQSERKTRRNINT